MAPPISSSETTALAWRARTTEPGMPQIVLENSSWAMTAAPAARRAPAPSVPSLPIPVRTRPSAAAPRWLRAVLEQDVDSRAAVAHRCLVADARHEMAERPADTEMAPAGCDIDRAARQALAVIGLARRDTGQGGDLFGDRRR